MPEGDDDGDNIADDDDQCPDTPEGESVNSEGCSLSQLDTDGDTVTDDVDICPNTPSTEIANSVGCSSSQTDIDTDGDGVNDIDANADQLDMCPNTLPEDYDEVDASGCAPSQLDTDGDGVTDDVDLCPDTTAGATVTPEGCIVAGADTDGDGVEDVDDDFPSDATQWTDSDDDGFGDNWDDEADAELREGTVGQWVANATTPDDCPQEFGESIGLVTGCPDTDGDGWADTYPDLWLNDDERATILDLWPDDPSQWTDLDGDGFGDNETGTNGDHCIGQPGVADHDDTGPHDNGCPPLDEDNDDVYNSIDLCQGTAVNSTVDSNGCAAYQRDTDGDYVKDDVDLCPNTPEEDNNIVDADGCTPAQLDADVDSPLMDGPMKYAAIAAGVIGVLVILMMVISRIRSGRIDWDEDDDDDDFYDDDDDDDWSPFGSGASSTPTQSFSAPETSRGPPTRGSSPPDRAPFGAPQGPMGRSRGPPSGPASSSPPSGPSRAPARQARPSARPSAPTPEVSREPAAPVRKTRRTATKAPAQTDTDRPVRKTRRTSRSPAAEPAPQTRKTRRTAASGKRTRRSKASASFDDLFGPDEKADFDDAVAAAKERLIVGDSEQSVLARLQSEGWNVKQSKHILGQARP